MATGFMARHCSALFAALCATLFAAFFATASYAQEVVLVGVIGDRAALLQIDGATPRKVGVGQRAAGVTLVSVASDRATVELDGKRRILILGQQQGIGAAPPSGRQSAVLSADRGGHFLADGQVNGGYVRFLVDTGASSIALPAQDAVRLGIDYRKGQRGMTMTANGAAPVYSIRLDTVKVGNIELHGVDAVVLESGLGFALLGMSFLNRVEMTRDGATMTLLRRY
jgi:aspartyl protease family protein